MLINNTKKCKTVNSEIKELTQVLLTHTNNGEWGNAARVIKYLAYLAQDKISSEFESIMAQEVHNEAKGAIIEA